MQPPVKETCLCFLKSKSLVKKLKTLHVLLRSFSASRWRSPTQYDYYLIGVWVVSEVQEIIYLTGDKVDWKVLH